MPEAVEETSTQQDAFEAALAQAEEEMELSDDGSAQVTTPEKEEIEEKPEASEQLQEAVAEADSAEEETYRKRYEDLLPHADRAVNENKRLREELTELKGTVNAIIAGKSQEDGGEESESFERALSDPKEFHKVLRESIDSAVSARFKDLNVEEYIEQQRLAQQVVEAAQRYPDFNDYLPVMRTIVENLPPDDKVDPDALYRAAKAVVSGQPGAKSPESGETNGNGATERTSESSRKVSAEQVKRRALRGQTEVGDSDADLAEEEPEIKTPEDAARLALRQLQQAR